MNVQKVRKYNACNQQKQLTSKAGCPGCGRASDGAVRAWQLGKGGQLSTDGSELHQDDSMIRNIAWQQVESALISFNSMIPGLLSFHTFHLGWDFWTC